MSKLAEMLKRFSKEKKKEVRDDEFIADKGRWSYRVSTILNKTKLVDFFNAMKRKTGGVKENFKDVALDSWEIDQDTLTKFEGKIIKDICSFPEILDQVKKDLPSFVLVSQKVDSMKFTEIDSICYRVEIVLSGACEGA